jgi:hypothetical protein
VNEISAPSSLRQRSPSQVVRLLEENEVSKQLVQLFRLAELAGYQVEFSQEKEGGVRVERIGNISRHDPVTRAIFGMTYERVT